MTRAGLVLVFVVACVDDDAGDAAGDGTDSDARPRQCVAPPGLGSPSSVPALVELVDALPRPISLPCLIESLDRPLEIYASTSTAGAQPAQGQRSPRIFVTNGALRLSLVIEGDGINTLELAQDVGDRRSVKGEIAFPIVGPFAPDEPYTRVFAGSGTVCGTCHGEEYSETEIHPSAYSSEVFQDDPSESLPLSLVRQYFRDCDPAREPDRCARLDALFGHGEVSPGDLPRLAKVCRER